MVSLLRCTVRCPHSHALDLMSAPLGPHPYVFALLATLTLIPSPLCLRPYVLVLMPSPLCHHPNAFTLMSRPYALALIMSSPLCLHPYVLDLMPSSYMMYRQTQNGTCRVSCARARLNTNSFNGDISKLILSSVCVCVCSQALTFKCEFFFNGDISKWDVCERI